MPSDKLFRNIRDKTNTIAGSSDITALLHVSQNDTELEKVRKVYVGMSQIKLESPPFQLRSVISN